MSTRSVSAGPTMKSRQEVIVGRLLTAEEVSGLPHDQRYTFRSVRPSLVQKVIGILSDALTLRSMKGPGRPYRCPACDENDPDVTVPVINACSRGPASEVCVECVNGHWAAYPCP